MDERQRNPEPVVILPNGLEVAARYTTPGLKLLARRKDARKYDAARSRLRVWQRFAAFFDEYGYAPTVRDLAAMTGLAPATVHHYLHELAAAGKLAMGYPGRSRTMTVVEQPPPL